MLVNPTQSRHDSRRHEPLQDASVLELFHRVSSPIEDYPSHILLIWLRYIIRGEDLMTKTGRRTVTVFPDENQNVVRCPGSRRPTRYRLQDPKPRPAPRQCLPHLGKSLLHVDLIRHSLDGGAHEARQVGGDFDTVNIRQRHVRGCGNGELVPRQRQSGGRGSPRAWRRVRHTC